MSGLASPEDQLKTPIEHLLKAVGTTLKKRVDAQTEAQLSKLGLRPDIAVYVGGLICGYIELKQPGAGADPTKFRSDHDKAQWSKLKSLPNLIYSDGREWSLYRTGERLGTPVHFRGDPTDEGEDAVDARDSRDFESLIRDFLFWQPIVPHKPDELAKYLAPLARYLREEILLALKKEGSAVDRLATEWRNFFFPEADDNQFADAYTQTVTYALLLARLDGATDLSPERAAKTLDAGNGLLAQTLKLLGQDEAREELRVGFELLQRSLTELDPHDFQKNKPDLWLYFYEDFLAAYDPKLRRDYGVYYTPREVVTAQVELASQLLEMRFAKRFSFADDGVVFLDPAVGTGTYLLVAALHALDRVKKRSGKGAVPGRASQLAQNMYGFEILVGPYAVAHLRLAKTIEGEGGTLPHGRVRIYLADTLASPFTTPPGGLDLTHRKLTDEREAARRLKESGKILVCLGNPPYDRQQIEEGDLLTHRKGGWVRYADHGQGKVGEPTKERPIFEDFLEPARNSGAGVHLKNVYNDYVYFWRWALWRMFEHQQGGGIVTFITASSYLSGPGFVGMREVMRRILDELWIIDLGGDNLGTRKSENVFNIQTPVAIAIGMRGPSSSPETPATVRYTKIDGTRREKLARLASVSRFADLQWHPCPAGWQKPFLPEGKGDFFSWPEITTLFPWQHSGAQFKRSWPIAETPDVLERRWTQLVSAPLERRKQLFRETPDRGISYVVGGNLPGSGHPPIHLEKAHSKCPRPSRYAFRSFDRQYCVYDFRLGDRLRPELFRCSGNKQIYLTSLLAFPLGRGPALTAAASIPDLHHFRGSFGGKDVIPLWRDRGAKDPNVTGGLLRFLANAYKKIVLAEDLLAYVYALLGGLSYTKRFWEELATPAPRVPITKREKLFFTTAALGRKLLWIHTYGERMSPAKRPKATPAGSAKCLAAVPHTEDGYPENFEYRPISKELRVGAGRFGPVTADVYAYEVSGLQVVPSWLSYRMRNRAGKKSSPLDDVRPKAWTPAMTDDLLELLWVLEATLAMEPGLAAALETVVSGPCFKAHELPQPDQTEEKPAASGPPPKEQGHLWEDKAKWGEEDDEDEV